jgi:hypothetical protein
MLVGLSQPTHAKDSKFTLWVFFLTGCFNPLATAQPAQVKSYSFLRYVLCRLCRVLGILDLLITLN